MIPRVLVIAGSDSGGGAGIQADIKTITMLGGHAMTAITAVTAQNTLGVRRIETLSPEMVLAQIDAVVGDIGVDAVKIGMIGSAAAAWAVADRLSKDDISSLPVVLDPVMIATTGARLADDDTVVSFTQLMARASVTTPNLDELAALSRLPVSNEIEIGIAAGRLIDTQGSGPILATGVRLPGGRIINSDGSTIATDDLLFDFLFDDPDEFGDINWSAPRIATRHDHGTGCTLASAIAVGLAEGMALPDAIGRARAFMRAALEAAPGLGAGHGPMGHGLGRAHFEAGV